MKRRYRVLLAALLAWGMWGESIPHVAAAQSPHSFRVHVEGQGPPMILIPGLASSGAVWAAQFEQLKPLHFVLSETARHFIMFDDPNWLFAQMDAFLSAPAASTLVRGLAEN